MLSSCRCVTSCAEAIGPRPVHIDTSLCCKQAMLHLTSRITLYYAMCIENHQRESSLPAKWSATHLNYIIHTSLQRGISAELSLAHTLQEDELSTGMLSVP